MSDLIQQSILNKSKKDKFAFVLTLPEAMKDITYTSPDNRDDDHVIPDTLQFSVYGALLPEIRVDSGNLRFGGQTMKFSAHSRPEYSNIKVMFTVDNRFNNYWVIWKWLDLMSDDAQGVFMKDQSLSSSESIFKQYQGTATLYALDEYNKKIAQFDYIGVLPVSLGEIDYNYRTPEEVETTFEFSFSKLIPTLL